MSVWRGIGTESAGDEYIHLVSLILSYQSYFFNSPFTLMVIYFVVDDFLIGIF